MTIHITDELIPELSLKSGKSTLYMDSKVAGLGLNVTKHTRSWYLQYRMAPQTWRERMNNRAPIYNGWKNGKAIGRVCIGTWPEMSPDQARDLARQIIARGQNVHPSVHLKALTGQLSLGKRGQRPLSFKSVCEFAYLCVLENRHAAHV